MKILLITGDYPPKVSGIGDYTYCLAENLELLGLNVKVLTSNTAHSLDGIAAPKASHVMTSWDDSAWARVHKLLISETPDIVHIQFHTYSFERKYFIQWLPFKIRRTFPKMKIITTYHEFAAAGGRWGLMPMILGSHANLLTNDRDRDRLKKMLPSLLFKKFHYIPLAPNIPRTPWQDSSLSIRSKLGLAAEDILISRFGFLHDAAADAIRPVFKALSVILQEKPNVHLIWLGESTAAGKSALDRLTAEFQLSGHVHPLGSCSAEVISNYLQSSDFALAPYADGISERRSSFLVLLAHGLPIIASKGTHIAQTLRHRENVFLVEHREAESWVKALRELINDKPLRSALSSGASKTSTHYEWPQVARQHQSLYESLYS